MADNYAIDRASYASAITTLYVEYLRMHFSAEEAMKRATKDAIKVHQLAVVLETEGAHNV